MTVPNWYETLLLALAAYRAWKLLAEDSILDMPRRYVTGYAHDFLSCCWCSGFWIALVWWGAYEQWSHWTLVVAVPFALSALLGIIAWFTSD